MDLIICHSLFFSKALSQLPSLNLFNKLNWLPISKQSCIKRNMIVFKRINSNYSIPDYLNTFLVKNSDIHTRTTRYSQLNMMCPKYKRSTEGGRSFSVRTIKEWNNIDLNIRTLKSVSAFKKKLWRNMLSNQKAAKRIDIF